MEYTGTYYEPIANALHNAGIFVSVVNPLLIDDYDTNRVKKVKTDRIDALKIASFALGKWIKLLEYTPAETVRKTLKMMNRQCIELNKILVMQKNSFIALLDCCFPNANTLFTSPHRESDGHEKWVDFVLKFPHANAVAKLSTPRLKPHNEMDSLASRLPEYETVMSMYNVGKVTCSQLSLKSEMLQG